MLKKREYADNFSVGWSGKTVEGELALIKAFIGKDL